jgi:hypothetical protein
LVTVNVSVNGTPTLVDGVEPEPVTARSTLATTVKVKAWVALTVPLLAVIVN